MTIQNQHTKQSEINNETIDTADTTIKARETITSANFAWQHATHPRRSLQFCGDTATLEKSPSTFLLYKKMIVPQNDRFKMTDRMIEKKTEFGLQKKRKIAIERARCTTFISLTTQGSKQRSATLSP